MAVSVHVRCGVNAATTNRVGEDDDKDTFPHSTTSTVINVALILATLADV